MRVVYIRNIIKTIIKQLPAVVAIIVLVTAAVVYTGSISAVKDYEAYQNGLENFEVRLKDMRDNLQTLSDNLAISRQQYEDYKKYADESVYMKIDSSKVARANIQYVLSDCENLDAVMNSYIVYINDGGLKEDIGSKVSIAPEYLRELIYCWLTSNMLNINVTAPDIATANAIMDEIDKAIMAQKPVIEAAQPPFNIVQMDRSVAEVEDYDLMNAQNSHMNDVRNTEGTLQDYESRVLNQQQAIENALENEQPEYAPTPLAAGIKYGVFGVVFGIIAAFVYLCMAYILSDIFKNPEELVGAGIPVLLIEKKKKKTATEDALHYQEMAAQVAVMSGASENYRKSVVIWCLSELPENVVSVAADTLKTCYVDVTVIKAEPGNMTALNELKNSGLAVMAVKTGENSYTEIEKNRQLMDKLKVTLLGGIVVE